MTTVINFEKQIPTRECGGCTLCCKLVPVHELQKKAGERCRHQHTGKGCAVSRYVIDMMPDFVTMVDNATSERTNVEVIQVWCDRPRRSR